MNSVDKVKKICKERNIPISKLEKDLGFANGYIGQLRKGTLPADRAIMISNYLDVSIEYILGIENTEDTECIRIVFSKNLRKYMELNNINQKELAEIVNVSTASVNDWVKAKKYPRIDKIEIMAEYFGILKSDLIEDNEKPSVISEHERLINEAKELIEDFSEEDLALILPILKRISLSTK